MRPCLPAVIGAVLLWSGGALAQADKFDDQPPAPAGDGGQGTLIQMCNEQNVLAALRECEGKIRWYDTQIRDFERRKARKDNDATSRQLQWLRTMQYDLQRYREACARIEDGLRQLRAHPETRCDASGERFEKGE
ncbi:MAG: hypothetical protein AB7O49_13225 [Sphingomonadales bacterium]